MSERVAWIQAKLEEVEGDTDMARESARGLTALGALHHQARQLRNDLDEELRRLDALAAQQLEAPSLDTVADVLAAVATEAADLPEHERREVLAELAAALGLHVGAPALRVVGDDE